MNKVIIIGRLGKDPEVNQLPSGKVVAKFSVATNRSWTDKEGKKIEKTEWHNVECWDKLAKVVAEYCHKGKQVMVEGRMETDEFMGQCTYENGQVVVDSNNNPILIRRWKTKITANNVEFLGKRSDTQAYAPGTAPVAGAPVIPAQAGAVNPQNVQASFGFTQPQAPNFQPAAGPVNPSTSFVATGTMLPPGV